MSENEGKRERERECLCEMGRERKEGNIYREKGGERERERKTEMFKFNFIFDCCFLLPNQRMLHILHANYVQSVSLFIKVAAEFPENYIRKWSRCVRVQMSEQKTIICNKHELSRIVRLIDHTLNSVNGYNVSRLSPVLESHFV